MGWVSPKVYAILSSSEEGKDILEGIADKDQATVDKEVDAFFNNGGKGASRSAEYKKAKNTEVDEDYKRSYGDVPDKDEEPEQYKKYMDSYNKWQDKETTNENSKVSDDDISEFLFDNQYQITDSTTVGQFAQETANKLGCSKDQVLKVIRKENPNISENEKMSKIAGLEDENDFIESIDDIDYEKAEKNEKINGSKGKNPNRKDKYGNELVSDEAFKVGQEGAKKYLDYMTQYNDLDKLKKSNIFLGGLQSAVSKAIIEAGYDPNLDTTYQDFNEIIGSVLGEKVYIEDYEGNATKGFTGKKYDGYTPGKEESNSEFEESIDYETATYPKGTSKEYSMVVNNKFNKALPILEKAGIKLSDFGGRASKEGGYEDNSKEIMDKYVFEPFRKKYPKGNNEVWEKEYQPLYDAIESVLDKKYNDWYIKNKK